MSPRSIRPVPTAPSGIRLAILVLVCLGALAVPSTAGAFGPLSSFGSFGEAAGQMEEPGDFAVADDGSFYVADTVNERIDVFSATGAFERAFGKHVDPDGGDICTTTCQGASFDGSDRVSAGGMNGPEDVALGGEGNVFVADTHNFRIDVFTTAGFFVRAFGFEVSGTVAHVNVCTVATTCREGRTGAGAGEIGRATGVAFKGGAVYVADGSNNRIDVFSPEGDFLRAFGRHVNASIGSPDVCSTACKVGDETAAAGAMDEPYGLDFGPEGDLYVTDARNNRIDVFTAQGQFLFAFGKGVSSGGGDVCTTATGCREGRDELGGGEMTLPSVVAVAPSGEIYVGEGVNNRVQEFTSAGVFVRAFGEGVVDGHAEFEVCTPGTECRKGGAGTLSGATPFPYGIGVVGGKIYVDEQKANTFARVEAFGDPIPPTEPGPPPSGPVAPGPSAPSAPSVPTAPREVPSNKFTFGKLELDPRKGTATLSVVLPGAGSLSLGGNGIKPVSTRVAKAMTAKLSVRLVGRARLALARSGTATVLAELTFTPVDGAPGSRTRRLRLWRIRPRH
jgi:DNA-binding beta-propeller fold protein YncE